MYLWAACCRACTATQSCTTCQHAAALSPHHLIGLKMLTFDGRPDNSDAGGEACSLLMGLANGRTSSLMSAIILAWRAACCCVVSSACTDWQNGLTVVGSFQSSWATGVQSTLAFHLCLMSVLTFHAIPAILARLMSNFKE